MRSLLYRSSRETNSSGHRAQLTLAKMGQAEGSSRGSNKVQCPKGNMLSWVGFLCHYDVTDDLVIRLAHLTLAWKAERDLGENQCRKHSLVNTIARGLSE